MRNIIFITIPEMDVSLPPAGMAALSPIAQREGYNMRLLDLNLEIHLVTSPAEWQSMTNYCELSSDHLPEGVANKIIATLDDRLDAMIDDETAYLAVSVFSIYSIRLSRILLRHIRQTRPTLKIICGGNALSSAIDGMDRDFGLLLLEEGLSDHCVFGEGEIALSKILRGELPWPGVDSQDQEQIKDLDTLPFADYSMIDLNRYASNMLLITGSRGCVRDCTFCDIGKVWAKFRYRSADLLVEEMIRNFRETGVSEFEFTDSLINGSTKNFKRFNELLYEAKQRDSSLLPIRYSGQFICKQQNNMVPEIYEMMHLAGCKQITVGIESFSENIRYHMGKKFSDADIDYHLKQCARWGIQNVWLMIVGYPTETAIDHQLTISRLHEYQRFAQMDVIGYIRWGLTMHIYDDTPISKMLDQLGIDGEVQSIRDGLYGWNSSKNPTLTLEERIRRRLELHEISHGLGYKMPNVRAELLSLKALAEGRA